MKVQKQVIGNLEKCYSLSLLDYQGETCILVAAEKVDQCRMYDLNGNLKDVIWKEPGGVMSLVPVSGGNGQFLATHRFYSPNDSQEAVIVSVTPERNGWKVRTLAKLPFVHRFDILQSEGENYLFACTLKSGHDHKDDWSRPGKVYAAKLPGDLTSINEENPLRLQVIKDKLYRNHGYFREANGSREAGIIACDQGVFRFRPPVSGGVSDPPDSVLKVGSDNSETKGWKIEQLVDTPSGDAAMIDLDGCGEAELLTFAPFHGDTVSIYKKKDTGYQKVYEYPKKLPFLHAIYCGRWESKPAIFIGCRGGERELMAVTSDDGHGFCSQLIDAGCGPANVLFFQNQGNDYLLAANRESDEIALYTLTGSKGCGQ